MLTVPVAPEHGFTSGLDSVTLVTWTVSVVARAPAGEAVSTPPAKAANVSMPINDPNRFIVTSPSPSTTKRMPVTYVCEQGRGGGHRTPPVQTNVAVISRLPSRLRGMARRVSGKHVRPLASTRGDLCRTSLQVPLASTNPGRFPGGRGSAAAWSGDPAEAGG